MRSAMAGQKIGYTEVGDWMARDVDDESLIYRRFDELGARTLLYLQSELISSEHQLADFDREDVVDGDMDWVDAISDWEILNELAAPNHQEQERVTESVSRTKAKTRIALIEKIRQKLETYRKALLLQSEISRLRRPSKRSLASFRAWFTSIPKLGGRSKYFLDNANDLVALNPTQETDYLSECLRRMLPTQKDDLFEGVRIGRYNESTVSSAVVVISTLIAAILLIGSITGLYFAKNDTAKLGLIAFFTALFALSIGLTTNARRSEIFAGTAAYAAVLVVFVSGDLSSSQGS